MSRLNPLSFSFGLPAVVPDPDRERGRAVGGPEPGLLSGGAAPAQAVHGPRRGGQRGRAQMELQALHSQRGRRELDR